jgi:hypothetical protein
MVRVAGVSLKYYRDFVLFGGVGGEGTPHLLDYKTGRYLMKYKVPEISLITEKVN